MFIFLKGPSKNQRKYPSRIHVFLLQESFEKSTFIFFKDPLKNLRLPFSRILRKIHVYLLQGTFEKSTFTSSKGPHLSSSRIHRKIHFFILQGSTFIFLKDRLLSSSRIFRKIHVYLSQGSPCLHPSKKNWRLCPSRIHIYLLVMILGKLHVCILQRPTFIFLENPSKNPHLSSSRILRKIPVNPPQGSLKNPRLYPSKTNVDLP